MSSGDVQWMKTGRGIIHSEMPAMSDGKLLGFQLWVNMPAKLKKNKPEYPKFETTYSVHVNRWYWTLDGQEGEVVYSQYKEWLTRATQA